MTVRAEIAKTHTQRIIPVSARFAAVLEMALTTLEANLTAAEGDEVSRDEHQRAVARALVFGDAIGAKVASIKRAWDTAVLKAHGYTPEWTTSNKLAASSRAALRDINLHFHDLRHEAGSRFVDGGMPIHHVKELLGHANIKTTDTYLNVTKTGLHESMRRFDESALRCNPVATKAAIDPALPCNADSPTVANVLVN